MRERRSIEDDAAMVLLMGKWIQCMKFVLEITRVLTSVLEND